MATSSTPTPDPPESIPQYILDGLDRQDAQTLEEISRYAEDLAAAKAAAAEAELEDDDEEVVRYSLDQPPQADDDRRQRGQRDAELVGRTQQRGTDGG